MKPDWNWQEFANCRGEDLMLFFAPEGERPPQKDVREQRAKAICAQCPVRNACLDYALSRPEKYGYWALNEDERASERRRRMRYAASHPAAVEPPKVDEKECHACKETLPAADFPRDERSRDGLNSTCKRCANAAERDRRQRRREAKQAVA